MAATIAALAPEELAGFAGEDQNFSFEWFSSLPNYRAANREQLEAFLSDLKLPGPWQGVDVACGVGLMSELCHEIAGKIGGFLQRTVCVDLDRQALDIAREKLARYPSNFLQAVGEHLPLRDSVGSFLVLGNGIHMFSAEQKMGLFREAFRVLRSGASIFFNSAFYDGTVVEGTEGFYYENVRGAVRKILRMRPRPEELSGQKAEAARHLTPEEYVALVRRAGFEDVAYHEVPVNMDQELWEAISAYGPYAQGALHYKYTAEVACPAMREAVKDIFEDPRFDEKFPGMRDGEQRVIPRNWLWVTARRP